jgi:hypothetical protein
MRNQLVLCCLILILISCNSEKKINSFKGTYKGYWAETFWKFTFYEDGDFVFKSEGYYGKIMTRGIYEKRGDSLFLYALDSLITKDGVINELYLVDGDSCIVDNKMRYDYCKTRNISIER